MRSSTRTRRVAPPRAAPPAVKSNGVDDRSTASESGAGSEDEGSRGASGSKATKRRKVTSSKKAEPREKSRLARRADPSDRAKSTKKIGDNHEDANRPPGKLPAMPLDILFEILARLTPYELVQLTQTCKQLRAVLLSRKSIWAWKAVRRNFPGKDIPDPPEDMSEPDWANLLFNGALCFNCGGKGAARIDFMLRKRLCKKCLKAGLINGSAFAKKCPELLPIILELVPYTNMSAHGETQSDYYWLEDLQKMDAKVRELQINKPEDVETFYEERRKYVESVVNSALKLEKQVSTFAHGSPWARYEAIKMRYEALGYSWSDLQAHRFQYHPLVISSTLLTDREFIAIRKTLDPILNQVRKERIHKSRRWKILAEYEDYKNRLLPIQRIYVPASGNDVVHFPCFASLLGRDTALEITDSEWADAVRSMPDQLSRFVEARRDKYASLLPKGAYGPMQPMKFFTLDSAAADLSKARIELMPTFAGPLELAIATFVQPKNKSFMGEIFIARDFCTNWFEHSDWHFDEQNSGIVAHMVKLLGLDPRKTTAIEMDRLNRYLSCTTCQELAYEHQKKTGTMLTVQGHGWRTILWHLSNAHPDVTARISLVDADLVMLSRTELPDYAVGDWYCNHCTSREMTRKEDVREHVRTVHQIDEPTDHQDLFCRARTNSVQAYSHNFAVFKLDRGTTPPAS